MLLISERMNDVLNQQIGNEFAASLQYVGIAAYFDSENLPGLAAHFYQQALEERDHAMRIVRYVVNVGGRVSIPSVPRPDCAFETAVQAVQRALEGEIIVTKQIHRLVDLAIEETDHTTRSFLQWFVTEQLEEVSSTETLLSVVRRAGDDVLRVEEYLARMERSAGAAQSVEPQA